jgi:hypothetical protein
MLTAEGFTGVVSDRMAAETIALSGEWLERLKELIPVGANQVFPSDQILDHIPLLITEIARYLQAPEDEEIAANAAVIDKARELGALRHQQQASVHQLLREFEILGEILEAFVVAEAERLALHPSPAECFTVLRRVTRALAHFLPQLALPKQFDTRHADALLGAGAPVVREYWGRMIDHLQQTGWRGVPGLAEVAA